MLTKLIKYNIFILLLFLLSCGEEVLCDKGYVFSNERCEPICNDEQLYNSDSNLCENKISCNYGYNYNKSRSRCEPICSLEEVYNIENNICEGDNNCNDGYSYNKSRNRCEPICLSEEVYSIENNICESGSNCHDDYTYNESRNRCEPICKDTEIYNIENNICESDNNCNDGYSYNESRNRCEPICKDTEIYSIENNICEKDISCNNNYSYNEVRERCEPICNDYEEYNIDSNSCNEIDLVTEELFNLIFRNSLAAGKSSQCPGYDFYDYNSFKEAMEDYPRFAHEGSLEQRKRDIAAFFANISHETTGGYSGHGDNRYYWGLCWIDEIACVDNSSETCRHCNISSSYECVEDKYYYGRGPIQLTWNYNYGEMGEVLNIDLLSNPDLLSTNATISFKTALWFWMTPQSPKPSAHDIMVGNWTPTSDDIDKNRDIGFGMTINIINGGRECGSEDNAATDRIEHYKKFCEIVNISVGENLDCTDMEHY